MEKKGNCEGRTTWSCATKWEWGSGEGISVGAEMVFVEADAQAAVSVKQQLASQKRKGENFTSV
jgi:hypothetical protein